MKIPHPIRERRARRIASEWHGGQWSALYAYCSTGHATADTLREAERTATSVDRDVVGAEAVDELVELVWHLRSVVVTDEDADE